MKSVRERVLSLCEKTNTKVGTLERVMALSNGTIKKWSEETVPNGQTLLSIANYFNVSVDYLLGREKPVAESDGLSELDKELISLLRQLTPEQACMVIGFVRGILTAR